MRQLKLTECLVAPKLQTRVMCIDPGICNVGLALVSIDQDNGVELEAASCTNISIFPCDHSTCKLQHSATMADWVAHFIMANAMAFASADVVLIERQPPGGLRCCEQLIFERFRGKAKLLQPRSMHSFFNMGCMNYEERKHRARNRSL